MGLYEILSLLVSALTPLIVLALGLLINKNLEKSKLAYLQDKEWQVRWAETFLTRAIKFEENISVIVTSLSRLQHMPQEQDKKGKSEEEIVRSIDQGINNLLYLEWDIQNFAQFADDGKEVIDKGKELTKKINTMLREKKGNFEDIRKIQFEYNKAVRRAHSQMLKAKE
ncbi:MAG: hypothetical protein Q3M24_08425 [Candidatus Electrothrix aestuarii]|uniref:Uncharacterized protein n=1 Tax=Candidatus Electrothrix aestuarii TaxID=3062594 RepID=A0AAU8LZT1_9BACT|nr:hypothetical protein [Candidatus Electrothrix aestuarii]